MAVSTRHVLVACLLAVLFPMTMCTSSGSSASDKDNDGKAGSVECHEPENPYDQGSGHYAGFEWADEHDPATCGGNSQSFIEGCEDYQEQQAAFEECESKKK